MWLQWRSGSGFRPFARASFGAGCIPKISHKPVYLYSTYYGYSRNDILLSPQPQCCNDVSKMWFWYRWSVIFTYHNLKCPNPFRKRSPIRPRDPECLFIMMTSSNGYIFRVTGHLCGEFTGHRWILRTKANDAELWCFLSSASEYPVEQTIVRLVIWNAIAVIMTSL